MSDTTPTPQTPEIEAQGPQIHALLIAAALDRHEGIR